MSSGVLLAPHALSWARDLEQLGWYHSMRFPDGSEIRGVQSLEHQESRYARFPIPADLHGKTVLDIGAWDGWFTFRAERAGATVTAIDCVEIPNFLEARQRFGSHATYETLDVFELAGRFQQPFDYVFFLGVLYHLKHPLLALEIVAGLTDDIAIVDSYVCNGEDYLNGARQTVPHMQFYETYELGHQIDNWWGPSVEALLAMCRAAGFARVELLNVSKSTAMVACYRRWEQPAEPDSHPAPRLVTVVNAWDGGINLYNHKDPYITWWFHSDIPNLSAQDLRPEIAGYGCQVLFLKNYGNGDYTINTTFPKGFASGWKTARLRVRAGASSEDRVLALDIPPVCNAISIVSVQDGISWETASIARRPDSLAVVWVKGLPVNADVANVHVYIGGRRMKTLFVGPSASDGCRQVNVDLGERLETGSYELSVRVGQTESPPFLIKIS